MAATFLPSNTTNRISLHVLCCDPTYRAHFPPSRSPSWAGDLRTAKAKSPAQDENAPPDNGLVVSNLEPAPRPISPRGSGSKFDTARSDLARPGFTSLPASSPQPWHSISAKLRLPPCWTSPATQGSNPKAAKRKFSSAPKPIQTRQPPRNPTASRPTSLHSVALRGSQRATSPQQSKTAFDIGMDPWTAANHHAAKFRNGHQQFPTTHLLFYPEQYLSRKILYKKLALEVSA